MLKSQSNPITLTRQILVDLVSGVLACLVLSTGAFAQPPAPVFPYDLKAKVPGNRFFANALKNQELPTGDDLKAMENYIELYSLPRLTLADNLTALPETRDLIKRDLRAAPNGTGPAVDKFNEQAMTTLRAMLSAKYDHKPVVRYNAVILIGELDQVVGKKSAAAPRKAVPYGPALPELTKWVGLAGVKDYLKAAALRGILRHAEAGIPAAGKADVAKAMNALKAATAPADRPADVHDWLQRRAADVLAAMNSGGQKKQ